MLQGFKSVPAKISLTSIFATKQGLQKILILFRVRLFRTAHGWGDAKRKNFFGVLKELFYKHGSNFDDVSKIAYPRSF